jgi:hypothetical protein
LLNAAVSANAPPPADDSPFPEQGLLDLDLVKAGEITGAVGSFHIHSGHGSKLGNPSLSVKSFLTVAPGFFAGSGGRGVNIVSLPQPLE